MATVSESTTSTCGFWLLAVHDSAIRCRWNLFPIAAPPKERNATRAHPTRAVEQGTSA